MATPTGFPECNVVLNAPQGQEENCSNLPIMRVPGAFTASVWELSDDEINIILETRKVMLCVWYGGLTQPPVSLGAYVPDLPKKMAELVTNPNTSDS